MSIRRLVHAAETVLGHAECTEDDEDRMTTSRHALISLDRALDHYRAQLTLEKIPEQLWIGVWTRRYDKKFFPLFAEYGEERTLADLKKAIKDQGEQYDPRTGDESLEIQGPFPIPAV